MRSTLRSTLRCTVRPTTRLKLRANYPGSSGWLEVCARAVQRGLGRRLTALVFLTLPAGAAEPDPAPAEKAPDATRGATDAVKVEPRPAARAPLQLAPLPSPPAKPDPPAPPGGSANALEPAEPSLAQRIAKLTPPGTQPPCSVRATLEVARRTIVACGAAGVWVLELGAPGGDRLIERRRVEGRAVGLFSRGGRVWVEIESISARPVELDSPSVGADAPDAEPAPPPIALAPEPTALPAPPALEHAVTRPAEVAILGRVLSSRGGQLVVDLGREHGVRVNHRIEFAALRESPLGPFRDREVLAVGRVISIADEQSLVEVGIGEDVPVGVEAALTSRPLTANRSAPPRAQGLWTFAGVIRPFFVLDRLGFGALNELAVGYQMQSSLRFQLLCSPLAFSTAEDGSAFSTAAVGIVSFDTRLFEIGLGLGAQTVNASDYEPGSGLTVAQSLRFGSLDGLHLSIRNDISLFHSEFDYSAFNGSAQIPVSERGWLVMQGGGGSVGYGFFEVGGKVLLFGNGTRDSLYLRGTIGYATVYREASTFDFSSDTGFVEGDDVEHAGPLVGFGMEWRI
jgi:hypothetical protein